MLLRCRLSDQKEAIPTDAEAKTLLATPQCDLTKIGEGGFGDVFRIRTSSRFALKCLRERERWSLAGEFNIAHAFRHHPHIVHVYAYESEREAILMEYIDNACTLCDLITGVDDDIVRRFSREEVAVVVRQVVEALSSMHAVGVLHGDMKLDNIIVCNRWRLSIKVCDFGSSRNIVIDGDAWEAIGTREYSAPEYFRQEPLAFELDTWALAVVMFVLVLGEFPFANEVQIAACERIVRERLKHHATLLSENYVRIFSRTFRRIRRLRYSLDDIVRDL